MSSGLTRRSTLRGAGLALLLLASAGVQAAENAFEEGVHYERLAAPVETADPTRIEVVEMFSYACVHCYTFELPLGAWQAKLPEDVAFRRIPAIFNPMWQELAKLYYTAEALGVTDQVHTGVFKAMHERGVNLTETDLAADFFKREAAVSEADFTRAAESFSVGTELKRAMAAQRAYGITSTPSLVVNGKYRINSGQVGGHTAVLAVADYLIAQERLGGGADP